MSRRTFAIWLFLVAGLPAMAGCAQPLSIFGQVTLDDELIEDGKIDFLPEPEEGNRKATAAIVKGKYELPPDRSPRPATCKVEIYWAKKTGKTIPSADPGFTTDEREEVVPSKYNTESTLRVDLKPGENKRDFQLRSK